MLCWEVGSTYRPGPYSCNLCWLVGARCRSMKNLAEYGTEWRRTHRRQYSKMLRQDTLTRYSDKILQQDTLSMLSRQARATMLRTVLTSLYPTSERTRNKQMMSLHSSPPNDSNGSIPSHEGSAVKSDQGTTPDAASTLSIASHNLTIRPLDFSANRVISPCVCWPNVSMTCCFGRWLMDLSIVTSKWGVKGANC